MANKQVSEITNTITAVPENLRVFEVQQNELVEIFNTAAIGKNKVEFSSLRIFNVSRNHIKTIPLSINYPKLEEFDASYNEFSSIPQYFGAQAPVLRILRLRGNPIKTIEFSSRMSANILDLSELSMLTEFDANVFNSLDPKSGCVELTISHNSKLQMINNSFLKVPKLCGLDLSYNNLKLIDHNWMNWSALDHGVDFQGNPIKCSCGSQWLLDFFVPMLYDEPQKHHYLYELRCASPESFKNHRLVHYLNHSDVFCMSKLTQAKFGLYQYGGEEDDYELTLDKGLGLWITIGLIVIIISLSLSIIIISLRRWHLHRNVKKNNRRFNNGGIL